MELNWTCVVVARSLTGFHLDRFNHVIQRGTELNFAEDRE
jgi:hypothetical protein